MIILIDNYDSFVHNLARYLQCLGQQTLVFRNDAIDAAGIRALAPRAIVLSPGPGTPAETGCSIEVVHELSRQVPVLGVCLGHQTIAAAFGARVVRAQEPMHGRTSAITHDGRGVFRGLPNPLVACRYHSLAVDPCSLPDSFEVSARTQDETVMAIRHRQLPVVGLQFHPESVLTEHGLELLARFLQCAGLRGNDAIPDLPDSWRPSSKLDPPVPDIPITF